MKKRLVATLVPALFLLLGLSSLSAQAFFTTKTAGAYQVRFSSNASGVQVAIDNQPAGVIPMTVWVLPGVHQFSFTAPGQPTKTVPYPVDSDVDVPFMVTIKNFPLTVNTNAPGASFALDGQAFAGNTVSTTPGNHTLTITAPGYQTMSLPFQQPSNANTLNVTLMALLFPLTVNTNAPGASLALDGQAFAGNTVSTSPGNHTLTINAPGYQTMTLPFQQPANANTLNVTLIALKATLTVNTDRLFRAGTPYNLYVDNVDTRGPVLSLTPGAHTLRIVSGSLSIETAVSVNAGQNLTIFPSVQWEMR